MTNIPEEGEIVCYVNAFLGLTPVPVSTIYKSNGEFYVRWPAGTSDKIGDIENESDFEKKLKHYALEQNGRMISPGEYSFMITPEIIITDTHENIVNQLEKILKTKEFPNSEEASREERNTIAEFLLNCKK